MVLSAVFLFLILSCSVAQSQSGSIVKTLPGFNGNLPFKLETGYIGVGENEEVQLFYYFIESERSPEDDPLLFWLLGGPGCSALSAIVYQNGPLTFNYGSYNQRRPSFLLSPYSWTKVANIIYLDSPVGTGFSYATTQKGYRTGDFASVANSYEFLRKWLMTHPKFLQNPLYVGGDSYGGIPIPILLQEITNGIDRSIEPPINLKGYILGNPVTELKIDLNARVEFAHRIGLLSDELYESAKKNCEGEYMHPDRNNLGCIKDVEVVNKTFEKVYDQNVLEPKCSTWYPIALLGEDPKTIISTPELLGDWCRKYYFLLSELWANDIRVQKALHVREGKIKRWERCNSSLPAKYLFDAAYSSLKHHKNLTKRGYRALIYSGDHDLAVPYLGTHAWIKTLKLKMMNDWQPWFVDDLFAGNVITYSRSKYKYNLTFVTIKGGAHTASENRVRECFAMIDRWLRNNQL